MTDEIFLESCDSEEEAWERASHYADLLRKGSLTGITGRFLQGIAGDFLVGVMKKPWAGWHVILYREEIGEAS